MTDRPQPPTPPQRTAFYSAAAAGLRAIEARRADRFGPDADARWRGFAGALNDADRLDLLLRDAAVTWGPAFSAAEVFGTFGLAPDEPFGPDWQSLAPPAAARLLRDARPTPEIDELAALLGVAARPVEIPSLTASRRLAVAGGAAMIALAKVFAARPELRWSDQILVVATSPAHRQLAGLLAISARSPGRTRLVRPAADVRGALKAAGLTQIEIAIVSDDAEPDCAAFAQSARGVG